MNAVKAVKDQGPDPKKGGQRATSSVAFPYYDLDKSIAAARIIQDRAGGVCNRSQAATYLGYSGVKNGSFLTRIAAAKMFGLIEQEQDDELRVSDRAHAILGPVSDGDAEQAKLDAFFSVELFEKVFDEFDGHQLPSVIGLVNLLRNKYNVVAGRVDPTVRILLDSAEQAGLFLASGNRSRMVKPSLPAARSGGRTVKVEREESGGAQHGGGGNGGGRGDGSGPDRSETHPWILGILKELPKPGTPMNRKRRDALISAFTATVGLIYPEAEDESGTG